MRLAYLDYEWKPIGYSSECARVSDEVSLWINTERMTSGYLWSVEINEDEACPLTGHAPSVEEAKQAAVETWRLWARKQAQDAGWFVRD